MAASIPDLQLWLLEALLRASAADEIEAQQLLRLPESFPFTLSVGVADLRRHEGFNIHRQGLDMDMVGARKARLAPPPKPMKKKAKEKIGQDDQVSLFDMESEQVVSNDGKPNASLVPITVQGVEDHEGGLDERYCVFAAPSAECAKQFRDGSYFGCIALTQALLEAVIRHVWQIKLKKKPNDQGSFDTSLECLHVKKFIADDWKIKLDQMWADRHSFHYLRPSVECDQRKLEEKARNLLKLLDDLEREFFGCER